MVKEGENAPAFSLRDQDGNIVTLSQFKGEKVLLYFYPRDFTPGCTTEACSFRDHLKGLRILGVSTDGVERHKKFAEKYDLPFLLLSDSDGAVAQKYDVWKKKSMFGKSWYGMQRSSFLIDEDGKILKIYSKVKVSGHHKEIQADLKP